jgi:hypothetical protein
VNHFIPLSWFILWTIDRPISLSLSQNQPEGLIINIFQENILYSKNVFKINEGVVDLTEVGFQPSPSFVSQR